MATITRIFWMAFLLIFTTGCSSYKMVSTPQVAGEQTQAQLNLESLESGNEVRVALWYEGVVEGKIVESSSDGISMRVSGKGSGEPLYFNIEQIKSVEKRGFNAGKSVALFLGIAAPIVVTGIVVGENGGYQSVNMMQ